MTGGPAGPQPKLKAEGVCAGYGSTPFVRQVSVSAVPGEILLIIGANGSGKTTFVKAVTGELPLLEGRLWLGDRDISSLSADERAGAGIGYVPQLRDTFPTLTVAENLEMGGYRLSKSALKARMPEVLDIFPRLAGRRRQLARHLSGGERRMLALGRALMADPPVLVLDEPTSNLSPRLAEELVLEHIRSLAARGRAIMLVEQRVALGLEVASDVCVLRDGAQVHYGPAAEMGSPETLGSVFLGSSSSELAHAPARGGPDSTATVSGPQAADAQSKETKDDS